MNNESTINSQAVFVMKKFLVTICCALFIFLSYKYNVQFYKFYIKTYYTKFYSEDEIVKKAWDLYYDAKYKELKKFLDRAMSAYLLNNELKMIAGLNYIKLGDASRGAEIFASSFENGIKENNEIPKIIKILFQDKYYDEILYFYDKNIMRNNVNCAFYYGASLYQKNRYKEAMDILLYAKKNGFIGDEIDYYTGITFEALGNLKDAETLLESAYESNKYNKEIKASLLRVYRKNKNFEKAETLLRRR